MLGTVRLRRRDRLFHVKQRGEASTPSHTTQLNRPERDVNARERVGGATSGDTASTEARKISFACNKRGRKISVHLHFTQLGHRGQPNPSFNYSDTTFHLSRGTRERVWRARVYVCGSAVGV